MKAKLLSVISIIISAAFALSCAAFADLSESGRTDPVINDILAYELRKSGSDTIQEWIDGDITENAGKSSEWFAIILSGSGEYDLSGYAKALERYISENDVRSATSRMKNAMALIAAGGSRDAANVIAESSVGEQGIMSLIYGLHLLNNGCECSRYSITALTDELLSMQFDDGGWAIMGENGDIDVTAMTVQALAPQYETNDSVRGSVDRAVTFMSEKQQDDGGYISFGTANPESAAQVLIAVAALNIDITDPRFIKNGNDLIDGILKYRLPDDSFSHTENGETNETATTQALLALTAYRLMRQTGKRLYSFDSPDVQQALPDTSPEETQAPAADDIPTETSVSQTQQVLTSTEPVRNAGYKPAAYCVTAGLALIACVILFALKKRRMSNFAAVIIVAGAAAAFIFFTDFRSSEEYYSGSGQFKENVIGTVTMTIRCDTIVGKEDSPYIPEDGIILDTTRFELSEGESVYDILTEAARRYGIQIQANNSYIAGIAYLYEYDFGDLSGWIYHVNGDPPFVMCSDYILKDGDTIEWLYTCELGNDLM